MKYKFEDIAINSTAKKLPEPSDNEHYIGLEHLDSGNLYVTRWGADTAPIGEKLLMKKGDVLFGKRRAYQKKVGIAPFDGIFSAHGMVLRPKEDVICKEFFPFFISSDYFLNEAIRISVGGLSPTINWKDLKEQVFDIPTIDEQRKLAAKLLAAYRLKESYKKLLAATDEMVKSRFIEMFEATVHAYEEVPIIALCHSEDDIKCGPFGTQLKQSEYQEYGVAVWGIPQINSEFTISPDTFVTTEKAKRLEQFSLIAGDIAMSRKGNVGQCALYPEHFENGIIASDVVRIRVNKDLIEPQFLVYQLHNSHKVRKQILDVSDGSIMAGINVTKLKRIQVYSPPMDMQNQFVNVVKQADKSKYLS